LASVYRNFDWENALDFVRRSADLSDRVAPQKKAAPQTKKAAA